MAFHDQMIEILVSHINQHKYLQEGRKKQKNNIMFRYINQIYST